MRPKRRLKGWIKISSDELRVQRLREMQKNGALLEMDGQQVIFDPANPQHVFHQSLRDWVNDKAFEL
ncbi:MAG: hypothetical protein R2827_08995 [Bdellovibrionales bacterium]